MFCLLRWTTKKLQKVAEIANMSSINNIIYMILLVWQYFSSTLGSYVIGMTEREDTDTFYILF